MSHAEIKNRNIFITGGCGFIGTWLIGKLIRNNRIWCYDNGRRFSLRMKELSGHRNLTLIKGDILDKKNLGRNLPKKVDLIMHLAAIAGVSSYYQMPLETMKVNMLGTYNLLEIAKDRDIGLFIDFSTSEVYGNQANNVSEEDDTSQGPVSDLRWTYSISKIAAEEFSHCYHHKYGLPVVSIRPFNVYGPGQVGEGAIQIFVSNALKNKPLFINGDGLQVRAWCYIEDFIDGVFKCMLKKRAIGEVFNIGNEKCHITTLGLAKKIIKLSGSKSEILSRPHMGTDIEKRVPDISKARKLLGYRPSVGLDEGLKRTIEWVSASWA
jgi:nucleoside-diphosphate-sugar epimerase